MFMSSSDFNHQLAIKLSRALNIVNPNDLLAQRVTEIAKSNSLPDFINAAKAFGKFKDSFLAEIHTDILSHAKQEETGLVAQSVAGITVHDSDVLQPEPVRQGGLVQRDMQHTFRKPAMPIEPPTPKQSLLGLDRLAREKRAANEQNGSRKKQKLDDDEPHFKGMPTTTHLLQLTALQFLLSLPEIFASAAKKLPHTQVVSQKQVAKN